LARITTYHFMIGCIVVECICMILLPITGNYWYWFPIRFVMGAAGVGLFTVAEIWINEIAEEETRGSYMGIFSAILSAGFAVGPLLIHFTGVERWLPFICGTIVMGAALIPLFPARDLAPDYAEEERSSFRAFLFVAPAATLAALAYGAIETGAFSLLPLYAVRNGLPEVDAATMLAVIGFGNVALQYPLGWLADHLDRRLVLIGCAVSGVLGAISLPLFIHQTWLLYISLFLWGGVIVGMYTIGLVLLGEQFRGHALAAANSAFVFMFGIGAILGPLASGPAMERLGPQGLPIVLGTISGIYALFSTYRYILRKMRKKRSDRGDLPQNQP
jgi:MFS family permease